MKIFTQHQEQDANMRHFNMVLGSPSWGSYANEIKHSHREKKVVQLCLFADSVVL